MEERIEGESAEAGASSASTAYFCHSCGSRVCVSKNEDTEELECERCSGTFVEMLEEGENDDIFESGGEEAEEASGTSEAGSNQSNPLNALVRQIIQGISDPRNNTTGGGAPMHVMAVQGGADGGLQFQGGAGGSNGGSGLDVLAAILGGAAGNGGSMQFGDYAIGSLEPLLNRIFQNEGPQSRPASKKAVDELPALIVGDDELAKSLDCAVCKEEYAKGDRVLKLPCSHQFHPECIKPWLETHNSCPVCRFELPVDDEES